MEEAETARQEQIQRMKEKTEELAYKNQMKRQQREKDLLWNQTHNVSQQRLIRWDSAIIIHVLVGFH